MKLLRYGPAGHELPGLLDAQGNLRSLSGSIPDVDAAHLSPRSLARLAAIDPATLPAVSGKPRLGVPFAGTRKFIAIGLNYADHAAESNMPIPAEPVVFTKAVSCLQGPNDDVMLPKDSKKTDWEVELGVVIGTTARYVEERVALEHVAGYVVVNDSPSASTSSSAAGPGTRARVATPSARSVRGCDADEVGDVQSLGMWLEVNGTRMQDGTTRTMIFGVATLISYVSRFMTLEPGD
ncbi:5-carboxymethyl-2-hydroxymuconate Delta-isomerase, partial [mine drainage metagenome]